MDEDWCLIACCYLWGPICKWINVFVVACRVPYGRGLMLDYLLLVSCMVEDGGRLMLDCLLLLVGSHMEEDWCLITCCLLVAWSKMEEDWCLIVCCCLWSPKWKRIEPSNEAWWSCRCQFLVIHRLTHSLHNSGFGHAWPVELWGNCEHNWIEKM